jgi:hypothetical protein
VSFDTSCPALQADEVGSSRFWHSAMEGGGMIVRIRIRMGKVKARMKELFWMGEVIQPCRTDFRIWDTELEHYRR